MQAPSPICPIIVACMPAKLKAAGPAGRTDQLSGVLSSCRRQPHFSIARNSIPLQRMQHLRGSLDETDITIPQTHSITGMAASSDRCTSASSGLCTTSAIWADAPVRWTTTGCLLHRQFAGQAVGTRRGTSPCGRSGVGGNTLPAVEDSLSIRRLAGASSLGARCEVPNGITGPVS